MSLEDLMGMKTIYKIISGSSPEVEHVLNVLAKDEWRPVTMACNGKSDVLTVVLENKIMEEAKLTASSAIPEDRTEESMEEIQ
jgi:hypothetical protein